MSLFGDERPAIESCPVDTRVRLEPAAANYWPKEAGLIGTVVGHSKKHSNQVKVLWDGRKKAQSWRTFHLEKLP